MSANDYFSASIHERELHRADIALLPLPFAMFIALRETLEAGIIIAVLLGFIEQIMPHHPGGANLGANGSRTELLGAASGTNTNNLNAPGAYSTFPPGSPRTPRRNSERCPDVPPELLSPAVSTLSIADTDALSDGELSDHEGGSPTHHHHRRPKFDRDAVVRSLKLQVWAGALLGLAAASVLGGVFLYIFYTFAYDLWQEAENLWEGIFCGIASLIILVMGIAFLRLPHARTKWRLKLLSAVEGSAGVDHKRHHHHHNGDNGNHHGGHHHRRKVRARAARGWILFGLPFITVLREGLEGVVFLGGIGITDKPHAILTGALTGFAIGGILAYTLFARSEALSLQHFTTFSTIVLFLMGAGLASRSAYSLERQYFINGVGLQAAESGDGPGSYRVAGNLWHFMWGNPEVGHEGYSGWWQLAQSLVGWNNTGTVWTVGTYQAYWVIIIATLVRMKYSEGRTELCGHLSKRGRAIARRRRIANREDGEEEGLLEAVDDEGRVLPEASGSASASRVRDSLESR